VTGRDPVAAVALTRGYTHFVGERGWRGRPEIAVAAALGLLLNVAALAMVLRFDVVADVRIR